MLTVRLDISFTISRLSKFSHTPCDTHAQALKATLRYLKGTKAFRIKFGSLSSSSILVGYTDADFTADPVTRKSVGVYIFILGNGPVSWKTKQQTIVAVSTIESEYIAA